ncbi:MAG: efflux RND transporter periplasmic adaptor subunit, partial [Pirellulales bacterium]
GIIAAIDVHEGDSVERGDVVAVLDQDVLDALLAIADQSMRAQGTLDSATAELALAQHRLKKLQLLRVQGNASQDEIERTRADVAIAEARVRSATEERLIRKLEYRKIQAQVERRTLRAPIDGVVLDIKKDIGEYVAPNDPHVLTLVQLDPLLATFSIAAQQASGLSEGQAITVSLADALMESTAVPVAMEGTVEFVAPVTSAESGTVRVKIRIPNPDGEYRAGERCTLDTTSLLPAAGH